MLIAVISGPCQAKIKEQIKKATKLADALEFRLDCFEEPFHLNCAHLPLPSIFTLRKGSHGGKYNGSEKTRLQEMIRLALLNPHFIDLEEDTPLSFIENLKRHHPHIKIILSSHNFKETPKDLRVVLNHMQKKPADFYKIACYANSSLDALHMLKFLKTAEKNIIAFCMGEYGVVTRILNRFSYAYVEESLAPGQLSLEELKNTYKFSDSSEKKDFYGLIGDPIDQSISHMSHNLFFEKRKINATYVKMCVKKEELKEFLKGALVCGFKGLSVTTPLKEAIVPHLNALDEKTAAAIHAVNTVAVVDKKLIGHNTDCLGALVALEEKTAVQNKKVIILGAGGAAKAIAFALIQKGALVTILNRNEQKALTAAKILGCQADSLETIEKHFSTGYDILINATSVEMPIDPAFILPGCIAMDVKTLPEWTLFLQESQKKNCTLIFGHRMFTHQAIGQFQTWGLI